MDVINYLLGSDPWVEYRTRIDLLGQLEKDVEVTLARERMLDNPQIQMILNDVNEWPGPILKRHNDAGHAIHKLAFLADIGFKADDSQIKPIVSKILTHSSDEGPFQVIINIPKAFGGIGQNQEVWMLCDSPLISYSLIKFDMGEKGEVIRSIDCLMNLIQDNGWPCAVKPSLGKFRGPGKKTDPCPYATLLMLKLMSQIPELHTSKEAKIGVETILTLWEHRKEKKPYLFAMGTDFRKLKAPFIWFDILHVLDVLTSFAWVRDDPRLIEMNEIILAKSNSEGRFTPESIWKAWSGWNFGQKKQPSSWMTFLVQRLLKRIEKR